MVENECKMKMSFIVFCSRLALFFVTFFEAGHFSHISNCRQTTLFYYEPLLTIKNNALRIFQPCPCFLTKIGYQ